MLITTTHTLDGQPVKEYLGLITGDSIGAVQRKGFFGGVPGRYIDDIEGIRAAALKKLTANAESIGANAVIGVSMNRQDVYEESLVRVMITFMGTAVVV